MKQSILIVEDDLRLNEIIYDYLDVQNYTVYQAYNGIDALKVFNEQNIDLVVLDIMIPGLDGFSVCRKLRQNSDVLIMIVSARCDEDDKVTGFDLGADEYVTKPFSPKVLVKRIDALLGRWSKDKVTDDSPLITKENLVIDRDGYRALLNDQQLQLTAKEFELLTLLVSNEGKVFTRSTLIDTIWGYEYVGNGRVVDTNIKTLRKKLGDFSEYIHTVINVGYKFEVTE